MTARGGVGNSNARTHGLSGNPLYNTWAGMMARCERRPHRRPHDRYWDYGGRGIRVYPPWRDVWCFIYGVLKRIGPRPEGCTLDRINPNGHYWPGNIRWATELEQQRNRRPRRRSNDVDDAAVCLCTYDCKDTPELCPVASYPWSVAASAVAAVRSLLFPTPPPAPRLPRLVEHEHTGRAHDCFKCATVDPYNLLASFLDDQAPTSPEEWCASNGSEWNYDAYSFFET